MCSFSDDGWGINENDVIKDKPLAGKHHDMSNENEKQNEITKHDLVTESSLPLLLLKNDTPPQVKLAASFRENFGDGTSVSKVKSFGTQKVPAPMGIPQSSTELPMDTESERQMVIRPQDSNETVEKRLSKSQIEVPTSTTSGFGNTTEKLTGIEDVFERENVQFDSISSTNEVPTKGTGFGGNFGGPTSGFGGSKTTGFGASKSTGFGASKSTGFGESKSTGFGGLKPASGFGSADYGTTADFTDSSRKAPRFGVHSMLKSEFGRADGNTISFGGSIESIKKSGNPTVSQNVSTVKSTSFGSSVPNKHGDFENSSGFNSTEIITEKQSGFEEATRFGGSSSFASAGFKGSVNEKPVGFEESSSFKSAGLGGLITDKSFKESQHVTPASFGRSATEKQNGFGGSTSFKSTGFGGHNIDKQNDFEGSASFRSTGFGGSTSFKSSESEERKIEEPAGFGKSTSFKSTSFGGSNTNKQNDFEGSTSFKSTGVGGSTLFKSSDSEERKTGEAAGFGMSSSFKSTGFGGSAPFKSKNIEERKTGESAGFGGSTSFKSTGFGGSTTDKPNDFEGSTSFKSTGFGGSTSVKSTGFEGCNTTKQNGFEGSTSFKSTGFGGSTSFKSNGFEERKSGEFAGFGGSTSFKSTGFGGSNTDKQAGFEGSTFSESTGFGGSTSNKSKGFGERSELGDFGKSNTSFKSNGFGGSTSFKSNGIEERKVGESAGFEGSTSLKSTGFGGSTSLKSTGFGASTTFKSSGFGGSNTDKHDGFGGSTSFKSAGFGGSTNGKQNGFGISNQSFAATHVDGTSGSDKIFDSVSAQRPSSSGFKSESSSSGFGKSGFSGKNRDNLGESQQRSAFGNTGFSSFGGSGQFGNVDGGFGDIDQKTGIDDGYHATGGCRNCGEDGHFARDCEKPKQPRPCRNCNEIGHFYKECDKPKVPFGPCRNCGQEGHFAKECTNERVRTEPTEPCRRCGEDGHWGYECPTRPRDLEGNILVPYDVVFRKEEEMFDEAVNNDHRIDFEQKIVASMRNCEVPDMASFEEFKVLPAEVHENLRKMKMNRPTPIQRAAFFPILHGHNVVACAHTGSGKTLAFLIPLVINLLEDRMNNHNVTDETPSPRLLVVAPTRELANQTFNTARQLAHNTGLKCGIAYGGYSRSANVQHLRSFDQLGILVATMGRLLDFIDSGEVSLAKIKFVVLDEADRMVDTTDFGEEVKKIFDPLEQREVQTILFSASFSDNLQAEDLPKLVKDGYVMLQVDKFGTANEKIDQRILNVPRLDKRSELYKLLEFDENTMAVRDDSRVLREKTLIFVNSVKFCDTLASNISSCGVSCISMHSHQNQEQRDRTLEDFRRGKYHCMVASNVCARGLNIAALDHVINYDMPDKNGFDEYVNRIGRTARAGFTGTSTAFIDEESDREIIPSLVHVLTEAKKEVPDWLLNLNEQDQNIAEEEEEKW
uniref:RNA helicase n=1 Tax=Caenorhabditis tropicalis TaxID=1561998 RepID=A0A1I7TK91_9PELO